MVFDDGDVWHFSMNKNVPWPKKKILKLEKSDNAIVRDVDFDIGKCSGRCVIFQ